PGYYTYHSCGDFCGCDDRLTKGFGALGGEVKRSTLIWNNHSAKALPPDVFLICGNRAWQGIPKNVFGGPCYFGQLMLLTPNHRVILNLTSHHRQKQALGLAPDCNDQVKLFSLTAKTFLAVLLPGGAAGIALNTIEKLACWTEKQANVTTKVLEEMLLDQNSLRHALLQNRAAIDFLLLAQGHGCEDFDGMCCMNLSDHSESIHKAISFLKQHVSKITQDVGLLDSWLKNLFGNIPGWLRELIGEGLRLIVYVVLFLVLGCVVM
ncbi:ERB1 protein, partial [Corythaixoides concolor]|nr:ERB1 protein [Corythaixoides concolor]